MSEGGPSVPAEGDALLAFAIHARDVRGRVVRLGPVLELILSAHAYPTPIKALLAEALVLTALVGQLGKEEESQLTLQAQSEDGIVDLLVCDYRGGELRGYVRHDPARADELGPKPGLSALFGAKDGKGGYLAITFDLVTSGERYQGVVPLEGASLTEACQSYFAKSEQVPTLIRVGVSIEGERATAGGILVQHMPPVGEAIAGQPALPHEPGEDWEHIAALTGSTREGELTDRALGLSDLLWRLFHEEDEVRLLGETPLVRGCRCTADYYAQVLSRFPEEERAHMRNAEGLIPVDCAFCSRIFDVKA